MFGCIQKKEPHDRALFIMSKKPISKVHINPNEPRRPHPILYPYYYEFNFIVDSAGEIFYFQTQRKNWLCGTGINNDTPPDFIKLKAKRYNSDSS